VLLPLKAHVSLIRAPCFYALVLVLAQTTADAGVEEFAFCNLRVLVTDEVGAPVEAALVKVYSRKWPLCYPYHEDFARTAADGICDLRVPRGPWMVIVGGGKPCNEGAGGQALLLLSRVDVEGDTRCLMKPDHQFRLSFRDLTGTVSDVDTLSASPSAAVPWCRMPEIGKTRAGGCLIHTNLRENATLFLVRRPTDAREGYLLFVDRPTSEDVEVDAAALELKRVHLTSSPPDGSTGGIEWRFGFPYEDTSRTTCHVAFNLRGESDVFLTSEFLNYCFFVNFAVNGGMWHYMFHHQGVDLSAQQSAALMAGGPLSTQHLRIDNIRDEVLQWWLGPVTDQYGNVLQWYWPGGANRLSLPIRIYDARTGQAFHDSVFRIGGDSLLFEIPVRVPSEVLEASRFQLWWDLGPYGGSRLIEGLVGDPEFRYEFDTIKTEHFDVHVPVGYHEKGVALGEQFEKGYRIITDWTGVEPAGGPERNFVVQPCGMVAGGLGQAMYLHGFIWWHPRDPDSLRWLGGAFHEISHRMEGPFGFSTVNEAMANVLAGRTIAALYGEEFIYPGCSSFSDDFFDYVSDPAPDQARKKDNIMFVMTSYLPHRFGLGIHKDFLRLWNEARRALESEFYDQDDIVAALYSALAREDLTWLFALCDLQIAEARTTRGMTLLAPLVSAYRERANEPAVQP